MPGPLARQTTTPSLPEGEEDNAGRGLGIATDANQFDGMFCLFSLLERSILKKT